jgi:alkanesulfonate monooxygenase SsuD/methylene tetrahydromethanopterin reductase-like flavin-dependent oxidoreductase (luciferase family)
VRFSIFLNGRSLGPEEDRDFIRMTVTHAERAVASGFEALFVPDHHFTGYMPVASDPMMFAAYLLGRCPGIYLGFSVTSVPLHNPVRFVERVNILDQLTEGRLLVGIGSGTTPEEMIGFGITYKEAGAVAEANLAIADALWAKGMQDAPVEFDNGFYRGRVLQRIAPAPYTQPRPRLMPVAMKEASMRRAAENGWPAFIPAFTPPQIGGTEPMKHVQKYFGAYRTALEAAGHTAAVVADALSWSTHTYQCVHVAESDDQATDELHEILTAYQQAVEREAEFNTRAESDQANRKTDNTPNALTEDWIGTWTLSGSPKTICEKLAPYAALGIGNILCGTLTGPLTERRLALSDQTIGLISREVMPHFHSQRATQTIGQTP